MGSSVRIQPGHASLCRVRHDLPLQAEPLADDMRGLVEHFGKVAAALLLDHDRGADNSQILERERDDQVVHGHLQFKAVVLLFKAGSEFAAHGSVHSRATRPMAAMRLCPARSALTIRSRLPAVPFQTC
jgi:hypothetical protein